MMIRCLDVLDSTAENGVVRFKVGDAASNEGLTSDCGVWGTDGFVSRPDLPSTAGACQVLTVTDGHDRRVIGSRDSRNADKVGALEEGDRAIVGSSAARLFVKKGKKSVVLYTEDDDGGASMLINIEGESGKIQIIHGGGASFEMSKDTIVLSAGGSSLEIGPNGISAIGAHIGLNAMSGNLGIIGPQAESPPAAPLASIVCGPSGMAGVPCLHWTVSPV